MQNSSYPKPISDDPLIYEISLADKSKYALVIYSGSAEGDTSAFPVLEEFPEIFDFDEELDSLVLKTNKEIPVAAIICALTTDPFESVRITTADKFDNIFDAEFNLDKETELFINNHQEK